VEKPADSNTTIELGMRGEDIVTLPPLGVNAPDAFRVLVLLTWLACFSALGIVLAREAFSPSRTPGERTFFFVWLASWGVGLLLVLWVCGRLLVRMFGWQRLTFDYDKFVMTTSLFGLSRQRVFRVDLISKFAAADTRSGGPKPAAPAITFEYAGKRISIAPARNSRELEWLSAELDRLLGHHRRR